MEEETLIETELDKLIQESLYPTKCLMLYNDDVNTFENVIECLVKYCKQAPYQAEQCAMIVHQNGKCDVKHGSVEDLTPIYEALLDNKLKVKIE